LVDPVEPAIHVAGVDPRFEARRTPGRGIANLNHRFHDIAEGVVVFPVYAAILARHCCGFVT
jgi:hypothetical protein